MIKIFAIAVLVLLGSLYVAAVLLAMAPYLIIIIIIIGAAICIFVGGRGKSDPPNQIE
jgi:hypothetical protein